MKHSKYPEILKLVSNNINVLLTGPAGSGKTTILRTVAEELSLPFYAVSMTRQTTLNALLGFLSITGDYIPSQFRRAVESGGVLLLDELDAADPNTILCLNTLENGFLAFPDQVITVHPDFRLVATANPQDMHHIYTGRSKLDAATLDRFDIINIPLDTALEVHLTDNDTCESIKLIRYILETTHSSRTISMRDTIRYYRRKQIGLGDDYHFSLLPNEPEYLELYQKHLDILHPPAPRTQSEANTLDELWDYVVRDSVVEPTISVDYGSSADITGIVDMLDTYDSITREYAVYCLTRHIKHNESMPDWEVKRYNYTLENPEGGSLTMKHIPSKRLFTIKESEL